MPGAQHGFRCDVPTAEILLALSIEPLPFGLRAGPLSRSFHRDIYLDTPDETLRRRDAACRVRITSGDTRLLTFSFRGPDGALQCFDAEVTDADPREAIAGRSEPARRLQGLVDPALLKPRVEVETERLVRIASAGLLRRPRFELVYDQSTVRAGGLTRAFFEQKVKRLATGAPRMEELEHALFAPHGLKTVLVAKRDRAEVLLQAMESEARARAVPTGRMVAVIAVDRDGRAAFLCRSGTLLLPVAQGSGEEAARHALREGLGSNVGELHILGTAPALGLRPPLEVWLAQRVRRPDPGEKKALQWLPLDEVTARVGSPALRDPDTLAALTIAARSDLFTPEPADPAATRPARALTLLPPPVLTAAALDAHHGDPEQFINAELSQVDFNARVLGLAEDPTTPLLERLFYLSIVASNFDELFMVRAGSLKQDAVTSPTERSLDGLTPAQQLSAIALRVRPLLARAQSAWSTCRGELGAQGIRVLTYEGLEPAQREAMTRVFLEQVFPVLTPRAMTISPGHPFPFLPHLTLSLAVLVHDLSTGPMHFATLKLPPSLPRFLKVPETNDVVTLEDVVKANLGTLYPDRRVEQAYLFRVTRFADLDTEEKTSGDLLQAIEEDVKARRENAAVRVEIERGMPAPIRELLLKELRFERGADTGAPSDPEVYDVNGLLDHSALKELAALPLPDLRFPPFSGRAVFAPETEPSIWEQLKERDVLVHHPYDDFNASVARFLSDAAADPDVAAIRMTLYRAGERPALVDALRSAALAGKEVAVFVELKARFDEERNIAWVKRLEDAGVFVVYGLVGLKNHAKLALVVRREGGKTRRYVHIGTGNYNPATARVYTDLGLFSADEDLGADVNDLFNELTGASRAPSGAYRRILVAPHALLPGFLERISREAEHAQAGRGGRIRVKINGLSDAETIRALYRASQAGVSIELIVRGVCMLRPGVKGLSERIRVISILGRFLEHARIYWFGNGGEPEILIGSADWRPRNLRRRVEVAAPITDPAARARLESILDLEWADPRAWELSPHGAWIRRERPLGGTAPTAQDVFAL